MPASGVEINRTSIDLPREVSREIIQKAQEDSAVMALARRITLPGKGLTIPEILTDPEPAWVTETNKKPVSKPTFGTKNIKGYTMAVIVPFSNQFRRDYDALYDACVSRLPRVLAQKFDNTVFGGTAVPGSDFDTLASAGAVALTAENAYAQLVTVDTNIAIAGGLLNGYVISPQAKGVLLSAVDGNERPLFINSVSEGAIPMILGQPTKLSRGVFVTGTPPTIGFAGDWTHAVYGVVEDISLSISDQASITVENEIVNLWERNMFAVRVEFEVGFRADVTKFQRLTGSST